MPSLVDWLPFVIQFTCVMALVYVTVRSLDFNLKMWKLMHDWKDQLHKHVDLLDDKILDLQAENRNLKEELQAYYDADDTEAGQPNV